MRTALAMGADRGILIKTDDWSSRWPSPRCSRVIGEEQPGLVILGKQAIDDDCNQTGQMLAALLGWSQGTFASRSRSATARAEVSPAKSMAACRP
jgi:electron transfer flavoprotein beta subunit